MVFLLTAAFVNELRRFALRLGQQVRRGGEFVAAIAIRGHWFLRLPMTVETRRVIFWRSFERRGA